MSAEIVRISIADMLKSKLFHIVSYVMLSGYAAVAQISTSFNTIFSATAHSTGWRMVCFKLTPESSKQSKNVEKQVVQFKINMPHTHIVHKQHLCSGCFFLKTLPGALYSRRSGQVPVPGARASLPTRSAPITNNNPLTMKLWVILHNPICWGCPNISPTWGCWIIWVCRIMLIPGCFNLSGVAGQSS